MLSGEKALHLFCNILADHEEPVVLFKPVSGADNPFALIVHKLDNRCCPVKKSCVKIASGQYRTIKTRGGLKNTFFTYNIGIA